MIPHNMNALIEIDVNYYCNCMSSMFAPEVQQQQAYNVGTLVNGGMGDGAATQIVLQQQPAVQQPQAPAVAAGKSVSKRTVE